MLALNHSILLGALGWSLINSLWQMALLWGIYAIITARENRYAAATRHGLALAFTSLGFLWFIFTFIIQYQAGGWQISLPKPSLGTGSGNPVAGILYSARHGLEASAPYLSMAYLIWLSYLSVRYLNWYFRLRQLKIGGLEPAQPALQAFVQQMLVHLDIGKQIGVFLSGSIDSPMTIGFLKPIILIPIAALNHLSCEQVETILLHELAHIKRSDYLVNLLVTAVGIVLFFNPFVRLLIREIRRERELCCDDLVLQFPYCPRTYAGALLSLEKTRQRHQELAMAATGKNNQFLLQRIQRVTGHQLVKSRLEIAPVLFLAVPALLLIGYLIQGQPLPPSPARAEAKTFASLRSSTARLVARGVELPGSPGVGSSNINLQSSGQSELLKQKRTKNKAKQPNSDDRTELAYLTPDQNQSDDLEPAAQESLSPVRRTVDMTFSIAPDAAPSIPPPEPVGGDFPYVASSSFSTVPMADSADLDIDKSPEIRKELMIKKSIDMEFRNIKVIDHMLLDRRQRSDAVPQMSLEKWHDEIQHSLLEINWEKVDQDLRTAINQNDQIRIHKDMELQLRAIQSTQAVLALSPKSGGGGGQNLKGSSTDQQHLRLMKQRLESVQRALELIRKKTTVVYI